MTEELFERAIRRALRNGADAGPLHDNATDTGDDRTYWQAVDHEYVKLREAAGVTPLKNY